MRFAVAAVVVLLLCGCASGQSQLPQPGAGVQSSALQAPAATATIPPKYSVVDLGSGATPYALNDRNAVVGNIAGNPKGFLYENGTMTALGYLQGDAESGPRGINDAGVIIGTSYGGPPDYHEHAALFYKNGTAKALATGSGTDSSGAAVSNKGVLIGTTYTGGDFCFGDAVIFDGKGGSTPIATGNAAARAVSDDGMILYDTLLSDGGPCRGTITSYEYPGNTLVPMPNGNGRDNSNDVTGINAYGNIVGYFQDVNFYSAGFYDRGNTTKELKYGLAVSANGINDRNWIVGAVSENDGSHAFIYASGHYTFLKSLVQAGTGWTFQAATAINRSGAIIGTGTLDGVPHGFLLLPAS